MAFYHSDKDTIVLNIPTGSYTVYRRPYTVVECVYYAYETWKSIVENVNEYYCVVAAPDNNKREIYCFEYNNLDHVALNSISNISRVYPTEDYCCHIEPNMYNKFMDLVRKNNLQSGLQSVITSAQLTIV